MYTDNKPIFPNTDVRIVFTGREYSYMLLISLSWTDAKISLFFWYSCEYDRQTIYKLQTLITQ